MPVQDRMMEPLFVRHTPTDEDYRQTLMVLMQWLGPNAVDVTNRRREHQGTPAVALRITITGRMLALTPIPPDMYTGLDITIDDVTVFVGVFRNRLIYSVIDIPPQSVTNSHLIMVLSLMRAALDLVIGNRMAERN